MSEELRLCLEKLDSMFGLGKFRPLVIAELGELEEKAYAQGLEQADQYTAAIRGVYE